MDDCPCGQPLHYTNLEVQRDVEKLVAEKGESQPVTVVDLGTWMIPRHYIALHGIRGEDVPRLAAQYGWTKVR